MTFNNSAAEKLKIKCELQDHAKQKLKSSYYNSFQKDEKTKPIILFAECFQELFDLVCLKFRNQKIYRDAIIETTTDVLGSVQSFVSELIYTIDHTIQDKTLSLFIKYPRLRMLLQLANFLPVMYIDAFEYGHRNLTAKRLFMSPSIELEEFVYDQLKDQSVFVKSNGCFVRSIRVMLDDVKQSKKLTKLFYDEPENKNTNQQLEVLVGNRGWWPTKKNNFGVLPKEILEKKQEFEKWYKQKHSRRRLDWNIAEGTAEIELTLNEGTLSVHCSSIQMIILTLFNTKHYLSFSEIFDGTGAGDAPEKLQKDVVCRELVGLLSTDILVQTNVDKFCINMQRSSSSSSSSMSASASSPACVTTFYDPNNPKNICLSKAKMLSTSDKLKVQHAILYRVKQCSSKGHDHKELVLNLLKYFKGSTLLFLTPAQIREQIDTLITNDSIVRDPKNRNVYYFNL